MTTLVQARSERQIAAGLLLSLLARNLKTRYRGSAIGVFWTLLNPAVQLVIYSVVFSLIVRGIDLKPYPVFLLAGLLPWTAFSQGLSTASVSIIANAPLVKKVYFRLELLPVAEILTATVNLLISLGLVIVGLLVYRHGLDIQLVMLPVLVLLQLVFTVAVGVILAAVTCYFRDVEYLLNLFLMVFFYATPIIYPISIVKPHLDAAGKMVGHPALYAILAANPMSWLMGGYQDVIFWQRWPDPLQLLGFTVLTVVLCAGAVLVFRRLRPHLTEEL